MRGTRLSAVFALALAVAVGCDDGGSKGNGNTPSGNNGDTGNNGANTGGNNGANTGGSNGVDASEPVGQGSVQGVVYGIKNGAPAPLLNATIRTAAGQTAMTDNTGTFTLSAIDAANDVVLNALAEGYSEGLRNVDVVKDQTTYVEFFVKQVTVKGTISADKGGRVKDANTGASAKFQSGSLVKKDGTPAVGEVTVEITTIDPTNKDDLKSFPGHFEAKDKDGKAGLLETYAPMEVRAKSKEGDPLTIKSDKQAELEFPFPNDVPNAPEKIDLWSLDEKTGQWQHEGVAEKGKDDTGKDVYKAKITHLSWWNCDAFINEITCVRGCVKDASGAPVPGARAQFVGQGWSFSETDYADAQGCFYSNLKQNSGVVILASSAAGISDPKPITTDAVQKRWETDKTACQDLGDIALKARDTSNPCPAGYTNCGFGPKVYCHDLLNDKRQCSATGSCDDAVACGSKEWNPAYGPYGSICQQGQCVCPAGKVQCPGDFQCTSLNDRYSCGTTCENKKSCAADEVCNAGTCTKLECPQGTTLCTGGRGPVCSDLQTDADNCGACQTQCGDRILTRYVNDGRYSCNAGTCGCSDPAASKCGTSTTIYICANTKEDRDNCGGCATTVASPTRDTTKQCPDAQTCESGVCTELTCAQGQTLCNNACVDTNTDNNNCGQCGRSCQQGSQMCVAGNCECTTGYGNCNPQQQQAYCQPLAESTQNCGACGVTCAADETCFEGACAKLNCPTNLTVCDNWCVNTQTSEQYCGACKTPEGGSTACSWDKQCVGGACVCPQGQTLCGNSCVTTATNAQNCGACGTTCSGGSCSAGQCTCPAGYVLCGAAPQFTCVFGTSCGT